MNDPDRKINPAAVRYIKLGEAGMWEQECLRRNIIRFGFDTGDARTMGLCLQGRWNDIREEWRRSGRSDGTATRFTNETKLFFEDNGDTLWVTFVGERLYWGFLTPELPKAYGDDNSCWREVEGGWSSTDVCGEDLTKAKLSGAITKLAAYRGTSCGVDSARHLVARINGEKTQELEQAIANLSELRASLQPLIRMLGPHDFEILVDLIFGSSGWRRISSVGKTQKTLDMDIELPSTNERAFVQVKSRTNQREFVEYQQQKQSMSLYSRMFFVFHTGAVVSDDPDTIVIGPDRLAEMVIDAGLTGWLIQKVA